MSIYARFKREPNGFRNLIELWESTPISRRQKMIDAGMREDPVYTNEALKYLMTFEDILNLPDLELAELMAAAQPRVIGVAIFPFAEEVKQRFLRSAKPPVASEVRECFEMKVSKAEIGGAQLKMITVARDLEKKGYVRTKRIPVTNPSLA